MKYYKSEPPKKISDFAKNYDFNDLRPFYDSESEAAMKRISENTTFQNLMANFFPHLTPEEINQKALNTKSPYDFQTGYMSNVIWSIINNSSKGLSYSGIEKLDKNKSYLYISNHRDILLDSAILQIILDKEDFETSEISFGSNLLGDDFVSDFRKMNRMFTVKREGNAKELYDSAKQLSAYIRHTIIDKNVSVWLAQGNGRTKDGSDLTQTGLLKMLNMSGEGDFSKNFSELNIVPISISYEYEPCDALKVQELYLTELHGEYKKAPGEDVNSILTGIKQQKGKIHVSFGNVLNGGLNTLNNCASDNEKTKQLTKLINESIYKSFKLFSSNFIAYDILNNVTLFEKNYSLNEKENFVAYANSQIKHLMGESEVLINQFYSLYANPVSNFLQTNYQPAI